MDVIDEFKQVQKELKEIKKHLIFTRIDKTTHDLAVCCKKYYNTKLNEHIGNRIVYAEVPKDQINPTMKRIEDIMGNMVSEIRKICHIYMEIRRCIKTLRSLDS